jgi:OPA family sugar phosphate sensor protein UhpC-like MFS transporter
MSPQERELRRVRWLVFASTWLSYAGFYMCRKVFGVIKKPLKEALSIDDIELAHIGTAYLVAYALGQFFTAWISRRVRSRTILLYGMGVAVLCNIFIGAVLPMGEGAYWPIFFAMFVHGFSQATGWSANVGIMTQWTTRKERGTVMAVWGTCYQLGSAFAKIFAAFMFGWQGLVWAFWASSIVLAAVWVFFYFFCKERDAEEEEVAVELPAAVKEERARETKQIIQLIIAMGLIYFSFKFVRYALDSWSSLLIAERFKSLETETAGYLSSIFDWVGFLGVFVAGMLSDKLFKGQRTPMIFLGTVAMFGASLFLFYFGLNSPVFFAISLGLVGFTLMGPDSLLSGAGAMDVGGSRWAVIAASVINGIGSIGPIFQEEIIGWLNTAHGIEAVLFLLVGVCGIAVLGTGLLLLSVRRRGISL